MAISRNKTKKLSHYDASRSRFDGRRFCQAAHRPRSRGERFRGDEPRRCFAHCRGIRKAIRWKSRASRESMAAKRTSELIPMCHPIPLSKVDVEAKVEKDGVAIRTLARTTAVTGVEMEALVAASVAALTVYDMCKALDKGIEIREDRICCASRAARAASTGAVDRRRSARASRSRGQMMIPLPSSPSVIPVRAANAPISRDLRPPRYCASTASTVAIRRSFPTSSQPSKSS